MHSVEDGIANGTAIAEVALIALAGDDREQAVRIHLQDASAGEFNDIRVARAIEVDPERLVELGAGGGDIFGIDTAARKQDEFVCACCRRPSESERDHCEPRSTAEHGPPRASTKRCHGVRSSHYLEGVLVPKSARI